MRCTISACLAIAVGCGLLVGCASEETPGGPGPVVEAFYLHLNDGAYVEAKGLYNAEALAVLDDPDDDSDVAFRSWAESETKSGIISEVEIMNASIEEAKASVDFEIVYQDGTTAKRTVSMTQEDGEWKLGFISS